MKIRLILTSLLCVFLVKPSCSRENRFYTHVLSDTVLGDGKDVLILLDVEHNGKIMPFMTYSSLIYRNLSKNLNINYLEYKNLMYAILDKDTVIKSTLIDTYNWCSEIDSNVMISYANISKVDFIETYFCNRVVKYDGMVSTAIYCLFKHKITYKYTANGHRLLIFNRGLDRKLVRRYYKRKNQTIRNEDGSLRPPC